MSQLRLEKQSTPVGGIATIQGMLYLNATGQLCYMLSDLVEVIVGAAPVLPSAITTAPTWIKVGNALPYTDFQVAAVSKSNTLFSLVAGGIISGVKIKHSTAFAGAAISLVTMEVGISGTEDLYAPAFNVLQATGNGVFQMSNVMSSESHGGATNVLITARSTGANLSALSAGVVDVWALLSKAL